MTVPVVWKEKKTKKKRFMNPTTMGDDTDDQEVVVTAARENDEDSLLVEHITQFIDTQQWDALRSAVERHSHIAQRVVNVTTGWTLLHWITQIGSTPVGLIQLVAQYQPSHILQPDLVYRDTPLHFSCRQSQVTAKKVRVLLDLIPLDRLNASVGISSRNIFGGTPLHSACNHNAILEAIQALVEAFPRLVQIRTHQGLHVVSTLWDAYQQTIPGVTCTARILQGYIDSQHKHHFSLLWQKVEYLALETLRQSTGDYEGMMAIMSPEVNEPEPRHTMSASNPTTDPEQFLNSPRPVIHGLLRCSVPINLFKVALKCHPSYALAHDTDGNLPLHWVLLNRPYRLKERDSIQALLEAAPQTASQRNAIGEFPLLCAIRNKIPCQNGLDLVVQADPTALEKPDPVTGLFPFLLAAVVGGRVAVDTIFHLLLKHPSLV